LRCPALGVPMDSSAVFILFSSGNGYSKRALVISAGQISVSCSLPL